MEPPPSPCSCSPAPAATPAASPGVIDAVLHDPATDAVILVLRQPGAWTNRREQLWALQEKLNAYLSFALDGELTDAFPSLRGKPVRLRVDCPQAPHGGAAELLRLVREQIAFQGIEVEVRVKAAVGGSAQQLDASRFATDSRRQDAGSPRGGSEDQPGTAGILPAC